MTERSFFHPASDASHVLVVGLILISDSSLPYLRSGIVWKRQGMPASNRFDDQQERLEQDAVAWLVRLTSGTATDSDRCEAAAWRQLSPAHDQAFQKVERLWTGIEPLCGPVCNVEGIAAIGAPSPARPFFALNRREKGSLWIRRMAIAASVAALAVTLAVTTGALPPFWADARTGTGEQLALPLSDGSRIFLNTQAAVSIRYSKEIRQVDLLSGEASFQVAKDPARPFIVRTKSGRVRAVGTEFLVRETGNAVVVTVTEGVVEVIASGPGSPTRVHAGQLARYGASGVSLVEPVDLRVATAWQRGKLIFEAEPLTTVVEEINRYRPGRVIVLGEALARHPVSGVFDLDRLDSAVTTIEQTLPVTTVRVTDRFVFFR